MTEEIPHTIEPHPVTGLYNGKFGVWLFLASEVMLFGALFSSYILLRVGALPGTWPMYGLTAPQGDQILNVPLATLNTMFLITSSVTMVMSWASLKTNDFAKGRRYLLFTFLLAGAFLVVKYFEYKAKLTHHQIVLRQAPPAGLAQAVSHVSVPLKDGAKDMYFLNGHVTENDEDKSYVMVVPDPKELVKADAPGAESAAAHANGIGDGQGAAVRIERALIDRMTVWGPKASTFLATYFTMTGLHGLHVIGGMVVIFYLLVPGARMWKSQPERYTNRIECTGLYWHFVDLVWIFLFPTLYLL